MLQCPICREIIEVLTNVHCRKHDMTKQELIRKHGKPIEVATDHRGYRENMKLYVQVKASDFVR